jgi:hypothetical protein
VIYIMGREGGTGDGTAVSQRFDKKRKDGVGASLMELLVNSYNPYPAQAALQSGFHAAVLASAQRDHLSSLLYGPSPRSLSFQEYLRQHSLDGF